MALAWQLVQTIALTGGLLAGRADAHATGSSLLATRIVLQKKVLDGKGPARSLEGTAAALEELAANVVNGTETVTDTVRTLLESIREDLGTILDETFAEHKEDQAEVDRVHEDVKACDTDGDLLFHEVWAGSSSAAEEAHAQCRRNESSLLAAKQEKCRDYVAAASQQTPGPDCMCPNKKDFTEVEFDSRLQCLESMKTWVVALHDSLSEKKKACEQAAQEHDDAVARCNLKQSTFEAEFCAYRGSLTKSCSDYADCRSQKLAVQDRVNALVETNEGGRKSEFKAHEHIKCLLEIFETPAAQQREKLASCSFAKSHEILNPAESARTYSTIHNGDAVGTGHGRSMLDSQQAWSSQTSNADEWMQIDLQSDFNVLGVVTQARSDSNQRVTAYRVAYSLNGTDFSWLDGQFEGPVFDDEMKKVQATFPTPVRARYIQIHPVAWEHHISMRAGVLVEADLDAANGTLDIQYYTPPAEALCDTSPVEIYPCETAWLARHYTSQPWYAGAPTTECTQTSGCKDSGEGTAPPPPMVICTGTFVDNLGRDYPNAPAATVDTDLHVFYNTASDGTWVKMSAVNSEGAFQEARYFRSSSCASVNDQCVIDNWADAYVGSYSVKGVQCQSA